MSYDKRSGQSGARPNATGGGAVPLPGIPADFAEMLSSLPDAESSAPPAEQDGAPPVIAAAGIADMFSRLPDADSATAAAPAAKRRAAPPHSAGQGPPLPSIRRQPVRPAAPAPIVRPGSANDLPPGVEEILFANPPSTRSTPARQPVAIPFGTRAQASAGVAAERARTAATSRQPHNSDEPPEETSGPTVTQQILDLLDQNGLATNSQLRIEVHKGVVVVAGEVPTPYEKQLVAHFCRQVPGVEKFVDSMVVRDARPRLQVQSARPSRRATRQPIEWRLPFRAWHVGAAVGLALVIWGVFSLGTGQGRSERRAVYPLTGTLVFQGEPAVGAAIVLHPQDPSLSARPRATVDPDGSFAVTTYEPGDGAPTGKYKVTIEWHRPVTGQESGEGDDVPPNVLPAEYASPATTPVKVKVVRGDNEFPAITFRN
jgi:hypothetical protein